MAANDFKRMYPNSPSKLFFDAGLNTKFERSLLDDNESPDCLNVIFDNGAVRTRGGTNQLNTLAVSVITAGGFDAIYTREDRTGAATMLVWGNGTLQQLAATTFSTVPSAQSVFTPGNRVGAAQAFNYIFFGDGANAPYKYDGVNFTRQGVYPAAASLSAASFATGQLSGQYKYVLTNINSAGVESSISPVMAAISFTSATIQVTLPTPLAQSFGISSRNLYRNSASVSSTFELVATINDNTTTTFNDNVADANLGKLSPGDNSVPVNYRTITFHPELQRLFVLDPTQQNFVWYSSIGNPFSFPALNFQAFGDLSTDLIVSLTAIEKGLLITGKKRTYIWYFPSNDPTTWIVVLNKSAYGSLSPFGAVRYDNGVFLPVSENSTFVGFAHLVGDEIAKTASLLTISSIGSDLISERIEPTIFNINAGQVAAITTISYKNKIYISIPYGSGQLTNNGVLVFDHSYNRIKKGNLASWARWDGINATQFAIYNGLLYYASAINGHVFQMNTSTYNDNGAAINSYLFTKDFYGFANESLNHKDFRFLSMLVDLLGSYFMDVTSIIDDDTGVGTLKRVDLTPGGELWDSFDWGAVVWGGGNNSQTFKVDLGTQNGRVIAFKFSNENKVNQGFALHYANFLYNLKGALR